MPLFMNTKSIIKTAVSVPLAVVIAYGCRPAEKFDAANYLKLQCEGKSAINDSVKYESDLINGQSFKLDDFTLRSQGSGRLNAKGPDPDIFGDSAPVTANSEGLLIKQHGVEYTVKMSDGPQDSTHIEISRSCERK